MRYFSRVSIATLASALVLVFSAGVAAASEQDAVMATVRQFVNGLNSGDMKSALAACASPATIIDDFPPHVWHGPTACADWATAFAADAKKKGITDDTVTLGAPWHVDVSGSWAYVVVPANYVYKLNGKPGGEYGSVYTLALIKFAFGWRITGWAWAKH